jgi:hypothetical protein
MPPTTAPTTGGRIFSKYGSFAFAMALIGSLDQAKRCVASYQNVPRKANFLLCAALNDTLSAAADAPRFHEFSLKFPPRFQPTGAAENILQPKFPLRN